MQNDLFGEPQRIKITGNTVLEKACNHLLDLIAYDASIIDGKTMKEIYSKAMIAVWKDNGLSSVIPSEYLDKLAEWMASDKFTPPENISRAIRYLSEHDKIRLPKEAVVDAERQRARISSSFSKK